MEKTFEALTIYYVIKLRQTKHGKSLSVRKYEQEEHKIARNNFYSNHKNLPILFGEALGRTAFLRKLLNSLTVLFYILEKSFLDRLAGFLKFEIQTLFIELRGSLFQFITISSSMRKAILTKESNGIG